MTKSIHVGGRPVWAEISLQAILRNLQIIREHVKGEYENAKSEQRKSAGNSRSLDYARDDKLKAIKGKRAGRRPAVRKPKGTGG